MPEPEPDAAAAVRPTRRALLAAAGASLAAGAVAACTPAAPATAPTDRPLRMRAPLASDRQGFNRRWFAPALEAVYVPRDAVDAAAHVEAALQAHGSGTKVVSGRHGYESFVYNESTRAIIDMSAVAAVGFDEERRAWFVDAGCENWTVYRSMLNGYGRTLPGGSCYSVGAGGHITGGGYGLLSRLHGLIVDHLTGVDIVTWDAAASKATLRHVSEASTDPAERDLFWALRGGGGGNFGVIVRYWFTDPPVAPEHASVGTLTWQWPSLTEAAFGRLLDAYGDLMAELPREEFTLLKLNHEQAGVVQLVWQRASLPGEDASTQAAASERRLLELSRRLPGGVPSLQNLTYSEAVQTLNGSGPNQWGKHKSSYLARSMPADQVAATYEWLQRVPRGLAAGDMAGSLLQVDSYGGAVNDVAPGATAVAQRSSILKLQFQSYWTSDAVAGRVPDAAQSARSDAHLGWIRGFYSDVYAASGGVPDPSRDPSGTVQGCYVNYPDADLGTHDDGKAEQALRMYFGPNLRGGARSLVSVKSRWDPSNVFRHAQSVPVT